VIWANGYSYDYGFVRLPVLDGQGFPIQRRGITQFPGRCRIRRGAHRSDLWTIGAGVQRTVHEAVIITSLVRDVVRHGGRVLREAEYADQVIMIGAIAGFIARWISPPPINQQGFVLTTVLGIIGSVVSCFLGQLSTGMARIRGQV
jgi:hypothetical protein